MRKASFCFVVLVGIRNVSLATSPRCHGLYNYLIICPSDHPSERFVYLPPFNSGKPCDWFWLMQWVKVKCVTWESAQGSPCLFLSHELGDILGRGCHVHLNLRVKTVWDRATAISWWSGSVSHLCSWGCSGCHHCMILPILSHLIWCVGYVPSIHIGSLTFPRYTVFL